MKQLFTDYIELDVRSAAILTDAYVAGTVITDAHRWSQLNVMFSFTKGSLTTGELKIEYSMDGSTWYQETFSSITTTVSTESLGEHQVSASGNYVISLPINFQYVRISVKGTGTVTNSSAAVKAILAR